MSSWASWSTSMVSNRCWTKQLWSSKQRMNVRPGGTTFGANDRWLMRDSSSCLVADFRVLHYVWRSRRAESLLSSKRISWATLFTSMLKIIMTVVGWTTLSTSEATGIPRFSKTVRSFNRHLKCSSRSWHRLIRRCNAHKVIQIVLQVMKRVCAPKNPAYSVCKMIKQCWWRVQAKRQHFIHIMRPCFTVPRVGQMGSSEKRVECQLYTLRHPCLTEQRAAQCRLPWRTTNHIRLVLCHH